MKLSPPYRPMLYEIIINLMNESEDLVVSIYCLDVKLMNLNAIFVDIY